MHNSHPSHHSHHPGARVSLPFISAFQLFGLSAFCFLAPCFLLPAAAAAATLRIDLETFTTSTVTNRPVLVTPIAVYSTAGKLSVRDPQLLNSGTNGVCWASNILAGTYQIDIQGPPSATRQLIYLDPTNILAGGILYAGSNKVVSTSQTQPPGNVAYPISVSDARYALKGEVGAGSATNITAGTNTVVYNSNGQVVINAQVGANDLLNLQSKTPVLGRYTAVPITATGSVSSLSYSGPVQQHWGYDANNPQPNRYRKGYELSLDTFGFFTLFADRFSGDGSLLSNLSEPAVPAALTRDTEMESRVAGATNSSALFAFVQPKLTLTPQRLVGRASGTSGAPEEIALGTGLNLAGGVLTATGTPVVAGTNTSSYLSNNTLIVSSDVGREFLEQNYVRRVQSGNGLMLTNDLGQVLYLAPDSDFGAPWRTLELPSFTEAPIDPARIPDGSLTTNKFAPGTVFGGGSSSSPTNNDTRNFSMQGTWSFPGGILAPGLASFPILASAYTSDNQWHSVWTNTLISSNHTAGLQIFVVSGGTTNSCVIDYRAVVSRNPIYAHSAALLGGGVVFKHPPDSDCDFAFTQEQLFVRGLPGEPMNWSLNGYLFLQTNAPPYIPPSASTITNGLVAYWSFDTNSTADFGGVPLSNVGTVSYTTTDKIRGDQSLTLGSLSALTSSTRPPVQFTTGMTWVCWFKQTGSYPTAGNGSGLVSRWNTTSTLREYRLESFAVNSTTRNLRIYLSPDGANAVGMLTNTTAALAGNTWYFAAVTYDGQNIGLKVDGGDLVTVPYNAGITNASGGTFDIGRVGTGSYFVGRFDEIAAWNRALSPSELEVVRTNVQINGIRIPDIIYP